MTLPLDLVLRAAGLAIAFALVLALSARGGWRRHARVLLLIACAGAYLACSAPSRPCCSMPAMVPVLIGAIAFPFAFWCTARVVLAEDRRMPRWAWATAAALLAGGLAAAADYGGLPAPVRWAGGVINKLAAFAFLGAALYDTWRSWDGDLVEPRRRLRWVLLAYTGLYGAAILAGETYLLGDRPPAWLDVVNVVLIDATLLAVLAFLLQPRREAMDALFGPPEVVPSPLPGMQPPVGPVAADPAVLARLRTLMEEQRLYRDPDLTVERLARSAGVPEYLLRRVIHQHLGHRHFAGYVNEYRMREVAQRLQDPQWLRRPILTLALEAGFGSIGPFNRGFKERYGITPTEYRARGTAPAQSCGE